MINQYRVTAIVEVPGASAEDARGLVNRALEREIYVGKKIVCVSAEKIERYFVMKGVFSFHIYDRTTAVRDARSTSGWSGSIASCEDQEMAERICAKMNEGS